MQPLVEIAIETGARQSELLALKWEDVDESHWTQGHPDAGKILPSEGGRFGEKIGINSLDGIIPYKIYFAHEKLGC